MITISREKLAEIIVRSLKEEFPEILDFKIEIVTESHYNNDGDWLGDYDTIKIKYLQKSKGKKLPKWEYLYF